MPPVPIDDSQSYASSDARVGQAQIDRGVYLAAAGADGSRNLADRQPAVLEGNRAVLLVHGCNVRKRPGCFRTIFCGSASENLLVVEQILDDTENRTKLGNTLHLRARLVSDVILESDNVGIARIVPPGELLAD